jgi:hypothetical protein
VNSPTPVPASRFGPVAGIDAARRARPSVSEAGDATRPPHKAYMPHESHKRRVTTGRHAVRVSRPGRTSRLGRLRHLSATSLSDGPGPLGATSRRDARRDL